MMVTDQEFKESCRNVAPYFTSIAKVLQGELRMAIMLDGADVATIQKQHQYLEVLCTRIANEAAELDEHN